MFDTTHSFDVRHYRLALRPFMTNDSLHGRQTIAAVSRTAGLDTVRLNCVNLAVDSAKVDGVMAGFRAGGDSLRIAAGGLGQGQAFVLDIFYRGGSFAANNGDYSRGYYFYPKAGAALWATGYTCSAPQDARRWMPCYDEPWDKADSGCVLEITVPDSFVTAANGVLADTVRSGDKLTWVWNETSAIATYLMVFHASRYAFWSDTARTAGGDTVPLLYFVWPQDSSQSRSVFATVPGMVECYASRFGPYPFGKYAMAVVDPFIFGGMENQDMTTVTRDWVTGNDQYGIAHELAHMWYGDLVTCGTWADIWLNEGFASYCEAVYDEHLTGRRPGAYMAANFAEALSGNANIYPIYDPPMELIYDYSMEYAKGAWVLHMLRWTLGEAGFWPVMRAYADSFAQGTAVTSDLQRLSERQYGSGLGWFFDQWVYSRAGHPSYQAVVHQRTHPDSSAARIVIRQTTAGAPYAMPLALACSSAAGRLDTVVMIDGAVSEPHWFTGPATIAWVKADPDDWVLKGISYPAPTLNTVTAGPLRLTLRWNRFAADPDTPAGYNVYRAASYGGAYSRVNAAVFPDTAYVDSGLVAGTPCFYKVTAVCREDTCFETRFSNVKGGIPTGVEGGPGGPVAPATLLLRQAGANPSPGPVRLEYHLPEAGRARLAVYNLSGQLVRLLADGHQPAGRHRAAWDGRDLAGRQTASGGYLAALEWEGRVRTVRIERVR